MHKRWGENWARTHQRLAQRPSSPEFCSSLLPAVQPRLIHSQYSAKTLLINCICYFIANLPGICWNQWSAQLPTPSFIPTPAFLWRSGESLADEQLSGPATQNKAFQLLYILTCSTEFWGVNKPRFPFVVQKKHSISHKITNMIKAPIITKTQHWFQGSLAYTFWKEVTVQALILHLSETKTRHEKKEK